ncbi:hypothetical protein I7I48_06476 [Histoplasma ohiense]|nr:hypothetical protein I7I48_06476 [Histoplasma ohiense (nom. inval.)]
MGYRKHRQRHRRKGSHPSRELKDELPVFQKKTRLSAVGKQITSYLDILIPQATHGIFVQDAQCLLQNFLCSGVFFLQPVVSVIVDDVRYSSFICWNASAWFQAFVIS